MTHDEALRKAERLMASEKVDNAVIEEDAKHNWRVVTKHDSMGPRVGDSWEHDEKDRDR
jgi:hypothetical protein